MASNRSKSNRFNLCNGAPFIGNLPLKSKRTYWVLVKFSAPTNVHCIEDMHVLNRKRKVENRKRMTVLRPSKCRRWSVFYYTPTLCPVNCTHSVQANPTATLGEQGYSPSESLGKCSSIAFWSRKKSLFVREKWREDTYRRLATLS